MKCCGISDVFLSEIAPQLSENKCLIHLNLSCNTIGDDGARSLATSLRLNRTLMSLALTNNHIGDAGALSLSNVGNTLPSVYVRISSMMTRTCSWWIQVLSRFELNHSEIVLRRKLLSLLERPEDGMVRLFCEHCNAVHVRYIVYLWCEALPL